jgi:hypothetical protein
LYQFQSEMSRLFRLSKSAKLMVLSFMFGKMK